jgi:hypothetical protein
MFHNIELKHFSILVVKKHKCADKLVRLCQLEKIAIEFAMKSHIRVSVLVLVRLG